MLQKMYKNLGVDSRRLPGRHRRSVFALLREAPVGGGDVGGGGVELGQGMKKAKTWPERARYGLHGEYGDMRR